jgi:uncharacterized protein YgbK (DUF1537 family)
MSTQYSSRIGVITDDLTGGGDVGVQFADRGLQVLLSIDVEDVKEIPTEPEVWIINTHSRSDVPKVAAKKVEKAVRFLKEWNAQYYYKKIDSTLRGNIGVEIESLAKGLEVSRIPVCAAFPDLGRITVDSVHYVHGKKISESHYSNDVRSPVEESNIYKLLGRQMVNPDLIDVKDAATNEDLEKISEDIPGNVFVGAAAWAGKLADSWLTFTRNPKELVMSPGPVFVVSGSLNPLSLEQIKFWESNGMKTMTAEEVADQEVSGEDILVKVSEEKAEAALKRTVKYALDLWNSGNWDRVLLNGGDTSYSFLSSLGIKKINIIKSLMLGIAIVESEGKHIVLKPGGYGKEDTLVNLAKLLGGR